MERILCGIDPSEKRFAVRHWRNVIWLLIIVAKAFSWFILVILHHINIFYHFDLDALKSCYSHTNMAVVNDCDKKFKTKVGYPGQIKSLITLKLFIKISWNFSNSDRWTTYIILTCEYIPIKNIIFLLVCMVKSDQNKTCVKCVCIVSVCLYSQSLQY